MRPTVRTAAGLLAVCLLASAPAVAAGLKPQDIETAARPGRTKGWDPALVRVQVVLDRLRYGPGVIDGHGGDNLDAAIASFQRARGLRESGRLDRATYDAIVAATDRPILTSYEVTQADVKGPFVKRIPPGLEGMAKLKRVGYRSAREELAERFHIDERLLAALNPGARFDKAGVTLTVPDVARDKLTLKGSRVEVLKGEKRVRLLDETGQVAAEFPASVGSEQKPAPSGEFVVKAVVPNPSYTYNPEFKFKGVKATKPFEVPPGPNGPVGAVWIDLSADTYGIHGVADPARIGRAFSNGCVRLTNWDALDLAAMVSKGTPVAFIEPMATSAR
ncbi:L,D-transpeptidase [Alsobacter sp. SYSU M60028]|uniref:L,D-transpeptidase n=1 Tax=Alsobacter ponti TaxID=2962936 RepID=A0ABT1LBY0_9HYPH|nr:L,D-transpeptidase [Alsobacter ponti]MCP8938576.1 L,D-transpeptidase [Alsobacter ponti]